MHRLWLAGSLCLSLGLVAACQAEATRGSPHPLQRGGEAVGEFTAQGAPSAASADLVEAETETPPDPCREGGDRDGDGVVDQCDDDSDGDQVPDVRDNCPDLPNTDQQDADANGVGDLCDRGTDADLDQLRDQDDNCPLIPNFDQRDRDRDGRGDICDRDLDGDRIANDRDNCPLLRNRKQKDRNGNGIGDRCEDEPCFGNLCGGCAELSALPDEPCGRCEGGRLVCDTRETLTCRCP